MKLESCQYDDRHGDLYISYELDGHDVPTVAIGRHNALNGINEIFRVVSGGSGLINISELARKSGYNK